MHSKPEFTHIYKENYQQILGFLVARLQEREVAEDLAGTVFYKAWASRSSFRPGSSQRAWLFRIARNTLIDYWRKQKDRALTSFEEDQLVSTLDLPQDVLEQRDERWALAQALDSLPGTMKSVVILRFIEQLSVKETASLLDITGSNVRTTQFRALVKLREYLGDEKNE